MYKYIRILEVPIYILVIAFACFEAECIAISIFLLLVSIVRLIVNYITDQFIYKKKF